MHVSFPIFQFYACEVLAYFLLFLNSHNFILVALITVARVE